MYSTINTLTLSTIVNALAASLAERPANKAGELVRLSRLAGLEVEDVAPYVSVPLWQLFGYEEVAFGGDTGRPNLPEWIDYREKGGEDAYMEEWRRVMEFARNEYGLPIGKGNKGFRQVKGSRVFDLGQHHWRLVDFLRAPTRRPENPYKLELDPAVIKPSDALGLGDGTFARVRPETIGYEGELASGEETLIQCRAFIWDEDSVCRRVYKGLIQVSNRVKPGREFFSFDAGYGSLRDTRWGDVVEIHPMVDAKEYSPAQGRVSDQRGSYDGIQGWWNAMRPGLNLQLNEDFDGAKMVLAGAGIGQIPLLERIRIIREALDSCFSVKMGVRRKVSPGAQLKPFTFKAPNGFESHFVEGRTYTITRDPALPDGTSSWSGTCVGFTAGNFFEVPTNESPVCKCAEFGVWEQMGGDFDGDDALVLPHVSDGGVVLGFNDRPEAEQKALLQASGAAGRKGAGFKKDYADGNTRWANARIAVVELGMYDFAARKALDEVPGMAGKLMAASMKPAIQWAVDRQKRNLSKPEIPTFATQQRGDYLMQMVKALAKPEADEHEDKTTVAYQWSLAMSKVATAQEMLEGHYKGNPDKIAAFKANLKWALSVVQSIKAASPEKEGGCPAINPFPVTDIANYVSQRRERLGLEAEDSNELKQVEALIVKARRSGRSNLAGAAEAMLSKYIATQDLFDQIEMSLQLDDAQTFIKVAPLGELEMMFKANKKYRAVHEIPGVVVAGRGKLFSRPVAGSVTNQREFMFAGMEVKPGQMVIENVINGQRIEERGDTRRMVRNLELVVRVDGFEVARVPGHINSVEARLGELQAATGKLASLLPAA